jgi:hypothetical protein
MLPGDMTETTVNEISATSSARQGGDIFMHVKRFQSDAHPYLIQCLMSETQAREIEHVFEQPRGLAVRREIKPKLTKSILRVAPKALHNDEISADCHAYLTNWVQGTLPVKKRPVQYSVLLHRWRELPGLTYEPRLPRRSRAFNIKPPAHLIRDCGEDSDEGSNEEDYEDNLPIDWSDAAS